MSRTIGVVPVRVGTLVVPVTVESAPGEHTHIDVTTAGARIVLDEQLSPTLATREVEAVLPEVQKQLARRLLN
jgi:hypothetical protein